jgi:NTE family protein
MLPPDFVEIPFLRDAGPKALAEVAKNAIWYSIPGGRQLFQEGESANQMWFVRSGTLGAYRLNQNGINELIGNIRAGEPVGEMSMISGDVHSASVYAMRDCELISIDKATFNRLIRTYPDLMQGLARTILFRTKQNRRKSAQNNAKVFSFISASPTIDIEGRAKEIAAQINLIGKSVFIVTKADESKDSRWFDEIERKYDFLILTCQLGQIEWSQTCMRQADRIWIFGRTDAKPSNPLLPPNISPDQEFKLADVVLIKKLGKSPISSAKDWLDGANATRLLTWRENNISDIKSLARIIVGTSVGLVLSGGGARAYAHIGAIRALREAGISFDFYGGTSMGGLVAACAAIGWNDEEIERHIWDAFVVSNPLNDYCLPVVALTSGKKVEQRLKEHFGDIKIEDMERPFFCVSTNLTEAKPFIHRTGVLRDAIRASISLPGILPPIVNNDCVFVDGAVLNNFPVDIMANQHRGANIGIDVGQQHALNAQEFINPPSFFNWIVKKGRHSPPPIAELLMRTATAPLAPLFRAHKSDIMIIPDLGDIELRDWKSFDSAVEAGYKATVSKLKSIDAYGD